MKVVICMFSSVLLVSLSEALFCVAPKTDAITPASANARRLDVRPQAVSVQETTPFCQFSHHRPVSQLKRRQTAQLLLSRKARAVLYLQEEGDRGAAVVGNEHSSIRSLFSPCLQQERADVPEEILGAWQQGDFLPTRSLHEQSSRFLSSLCTRVRVQHDRVSLLGSSGG